MLRAVLWAPAAASYGARGDGRQDGSTARQTLPMTDPLMILVAGPYRSGTGGDPAKIEANVRAMTETALELYRRGHLPVMGEWFALPLIEAAGSTGAGDPIWEELFHAVAERVLERCGACLRI